MSLAAEGVLVSGPENRWAKPLVRIVAVAVLLLAAWLALGAQLAVVGIPLAVAAGLALVVSEAIAARRVRARRWVVDTGAGFRWSGGLEETTVPDNRVQSVRLVHQRKYRAGIFKHVDRRFEVWAEGRPAAIVMHSRLVSGDADPLGGMIDRIAQNLTTRTAAALAAGGSLNGDDWTLSGRELTVRQGRIERVIPFAEIDHVGLFDGKLCLWSKGQEAPAARINPSSLNAPVLAGLLAEWVEGQAAAAAPDTADAADGSGLGRILFERRSRNLMWLLVVVALIAGAVGLGLSFERDTRIWGALLLVAAPLAAWGAWCYRESVFRCHERGIYQKFGRREKRVAYIDIDVFLYNATRMHYHGAYTGTQLAMTFKAARETISYSASVKNPDEDLDELRDHIAKVLAARMVRQVEEGQRVSWAGDMALTEQGVEFRRAGFLGSKPPELLPFAQIRGWNVKDGFFYLWSHAEPKPVVSKQISTANFFPGLFAFLTLWETRRVETSPEQKLEDKTLGR